MSSPFWPSAAHLENLDWPSEEAYSGGPTVGRLLDVLRPALRALFLLGHEVLEVHHTTASGSGAHDWDGFDLQTGESLLTNMTPTRASSGLNVAFTLAGIQDGTLALGDTYAITPSRDVLGADAGSTDEVLASLGEDVAAFVAESVALLLPTVSIGSAIREAGGGMVWLFDPENWSSGDPSRRGDGSGGALDYLFLEMTGGVEDFLTAQVIGDRSAAYAGMIPRPTAGAPGLQWLFQTTGDPLAVHRFTKAFAYNLQERGMAAALNHGDRARLLGSRGVVWLDALTELLARGAVVIDGLLDAAPPPPALETFETDDGVSLLVWGETVVKLRRAVVIDSKTEVVGSANWEYLPGDAHRKPTLLVVAGRGIEVDTRSWHGGMHWTLELHRVQSDAHVPGPGAAMRPNFWLGAHLIEPHEDEYDETDESAPAMATSTFPKLMARNKPDGLYLEFPVFGGTLPPTAAPDPAGDAYRVRDDAFLPLSIDLTFSDPGAGTHGYAVDVHYYTYSWAAITPLGGAHVIVWVTDGVDIRSDGTQTPGTDSSSWSTTSNGIQFAFYASGFKVSVEFQRVDSVTDLPLPWSTKLPITAEIAIDESLYAADVEHLSGTYNSDSTTHDSVTLHRQGFDHDTFHYRDSLLLDFMDIAIGFVPIVGDVVDIAETAYAWQTGRDKWGRPVSNFQLALMTIGAAVPLVSSGFAKGVGTYVEGLADAVILRSPSLNSLFASAATGTAPPRASVEAALGTSRTWQTNNTLGTAAKTDLVNDLTTFLASNPSLISAYVTRVTGGAATWLSVTDIVDTSANAFRLATIDAGYQRWLIKNPAGSPTDYLRTGARGKARAMAEALLSTAVVGVQRNAPRTVLYPSEAGRALIAGAGYVAVSALTGSGLKTAVQNAASTALSTPSSMRIVNAGALSDASGAVSFTAAEIAGDADALLKHVSPDGTLGGLTTDAFESIVGKDLLNGNYVSLEERAYRFAKALVVARNELESVGMSASMLRDPDMADAVVDFVRGFVARHGAEWGPRFEVRLAADLHDALSASITAMRVQLKMPNTAGLKLVSGPDHILYKGGVAYFVQAKAYRSLDALIAGKISFVTNSAGAVTKVKGPSGPAQAVRDAIRIQNWGGYVPPAGSPSTLAKPTNPVASGWVPVGSTRVLVVDDIYLQNLAFEALSAAGARTGKRTVNVQADLQVSQSVKDQLEAAFGSTIDLDDAGLSDDLFAFLAERRNVFEDEINAMFADAAVSAKTGSGIQVAVVLASEGVSEIPVRLGW